MSQVGSIDGASREVRSSVASAGPRELERERIQRLVRLTDTMIDELERLNLGEVQQVSIEWRSRLALLFSELPFPYTPWLRAHPSPTEVLDVVFDVQGRLLDLKRSQAGDSWEDYADRAG